LAAGKHNTLTGTAAPSPPLKQPYLEVCVQQGGHHHHMCSHVQQVAKESHSKGGCSRGVACGMYKQRGKDRAGGDSITRD
jgi:hypothetical protein